MKRHPTKSLKKKKLVSPSQQHYSQPTKSSMAKLSFFAICREQSMSCSRNPVVSKRSTTQAVNDMDLGGATKLAFKADKKGKVLTKVKSAVVSAHPNQTTKPMAAKHQNSQFSGKCVKKNAGASPQDDAFAEFSYTSSVTNDFEFCDAPQSPPNNDSVTRMNEFFLEKNIGEATENVMQVVDAIREAELREEYTLIQNSINESQGEKKTAMIEMALNSPKWATSHQERMIRLELVGRLDIEGEDSDEAKVRDGNFKVNTPKKRFLTLTSLQRAVWDDHVRTKSELFVQERQKLAAAFRWFTKLDMNEGIANHFSFVPDDSKPTQFYVNRYGRFFGSMCANDIILCDIKNKSWIKDHELALKGGGYDPLVDPTAFAIHGAIHSKLGKKAKCIMHLHPKYGTAFSCLKRIKELKLLPIDQTTAKFFNRLHIVEDFGGMGLNEEGERLGDMIMNDSEDITDEVKERLKARCVVLANHGVLVISETIEQAMHELFYLEVGIRNFMLASASIVSGGGGGGGLDKSSAISAQSTFSCLNVLPDEVAEGTALSWECSDESYANKLMLEAQDRLYEDEPGYLEHTYATY